MKKLRYGAVNAVAALFTSCGLAYAADIYVSPGAGGSGGSADPTDLQSALDTARTNGADDIIYLKEGTYDASMYGAGTFEYGSVSNDGKKVTLSGSWNNDYTQQKTWGDPSTDLDGGGDSRVLRIHADGVSFDFSIEYLDIEDGYVATGGGYGVGLQALEENSGALNLKIHHVGFFDNTAQIGATAVHGGGMYSNCYFEISASYFSGNKGYYGGAMFISDRPGGDRSLAPKIDGTRFENNASGGSTYQGGTIFYVPSPVITDSVFIGADMSAWGYYPASGLFGGWGGGGGLTIENSVFMDFDGSNWGAVLSIWDRDATINNSLFANNHAGKAGDGKGGAIEIYDSNTGTANAVTITNSTFFGNSGNAGGSSGGAIYNRLQDLTVVNTIFWGNANIDIYRESGTATISFSDVEGGLTGTNFTDGGSNINSDPLFVHDSGGDPSQWNLRLTKTSPALDTGNNAAPDLLPLDLDQSPRITDGDHDGTATVDMGAFEFNPVRDAVLRDAAAGMLVRAAMGHAGGPIGPGSGTVYSDVAGDDYNAWFMEGLYGEGVTGFCDGASGSRFCPKDALTKNEAARWLLRTKGIDPPAANSSPFLDVDIGVAGVKGDGDYAADYIVELANQGFTTGCDATHYCPEEALTHEGFLNLLNATFAP